MTSHYHLCFVVQDIEAARREMTRALGVTWSQIREGTLDEWRYRIVFSTEGPPFIELIEGPPGSPWDAGAGPRFDHLGYWVDDLDTSKGVLTERGAPMDFDATDLGRPFTYHRLETIGARIELVERTVQPGFIETWAPHLRPMPALPLALSTAANGTLPALGTAPEGLTACRATLTDFLSAIDHGRATEAIDLFTQDAVFAARDQQLQGREAITQFLRQRQAQTDRHTVHLLTNEVVRSAAENELVLSAVLLVHERDEHGTYPLRHVLNTTQTFRRGHDRWRIHARTTQPVHPPPP